MYNHAITLSSGGRASDDTVASLEAYVVSQFGKGKLRKRTCRSLPSSKNAVRDGKGVDGGYDGYLQKVVTGQLGWPLSTSSREEVYGESPPPLTSFVSVFRELRRTVPVTPASDVLFGRAWSAIRRIEYLQNPACPLVDDPFDDNQLEAWGFELSSAQAELAQAMGALLTVRELDTRPGDSIDGAFAGVTHKATVIAEQGYKARIITVPPPGVYTLGDMCRQKIWPSVLKSDRRLRPFVESVGPGNVVNQIGSNLALGPGEAFLSADLTKATDGFYHNAVQAVLRGLEKAGLGEGWAAVAADSLGVGRDQHCVKYRLSDFPAKRQEEIARSFRPVDDNGVKVVYVPLRRGILMGTPLSFTVLSIINGWACSVLGPKTFICGDDVMSCCKPRAITRYASRAEAVGSGLHKQKSFYGTRGFTFCEVFGLGCGPVEFFNPYPLKQFQRDGFGVLDPGKSAKHDVVHFSGLRRVCRVLLKHVRAKARRLGRPPELVASLGGLGHPSKGMRSIPKPVRAQLRTLVEDPSVNPFKYVTRIDTFFAPSDGAAFNYIKDSVLRACQPPLGWYDEPEGEDTVFVSLRRLNADFAMKTHQAYWADGGRYRKCEPKAMKPGKLRLPAPGPEVFGNKTPVQDVVHALQALRDSRGAWLPIDKARRIRGNNVTPHARNSISGGPSTSMHSQP
nr:MAG: hypothetical protein [Hangzhou narna-like virus]